ncbi:MAG: hypothetical protein ACRD0H_20030, partial [Actinomycetes bacterium]
MAAAQDPTQRLDLVLRALAARIADASPGTMPGIEVVTAGRDAVEILFDGDLDVPYGPFEVTAEGRCWTLGASVTVEELASMGDGQASPAPALVTVGTVGGRQVLIDLEATPRLLVDAEDDRASALVWSFAAELATSRLADDVEVIVVGDAVPAVGRLERSKVVASISDVIDNIERSASCTEADLRAAGAGSTMAARVSDPGESWVPTIVLLSRTGNGSDFDRLMAAATPGRALAVVVVGSDPAGFDRHLRVEGVVSELLPLGLRMDSSAIDPDQLDAVDDLLNTALSEEPGDELVKELRPTEPMAPE